MNKWLEGLIIFLVGFAFIVIGHICSLIYEKHQKKKEEQEAELKKLQKKIEIIDQYKSIKK